METIQNLVEYYDELYPVSETLEQFYMQFKNIYPAQVKLLQIGCGTGALEYKLAKVGFDVTGLEVSKELIDSASLRRRNQLLSIRFLKLSTLEMERFLGKGFYNVISCLNNRIVFIHDKMLMRKFFFDSRKLITKNGTLVLQLYNYNLITKKTDCHVPIKSSMRVKLYTDIIRNEHGSDFLQQNIETSSGKYVPVIQNEPIYPLTKEEIIEFGRDAGFEKFNFYSSFDKEKFTETSQNLICILN